MRTLIAVVSGLVVILGVASTNLWLELRKEHENVADIQMQLNEERALRLAAALRPVAAGPLPTAPAQVAAAAPATPVACKPAGPAATAPTQTELNRAAPGSSTSIPERDLLKDPEYRKARIAQRRLDMQRSNPGVAEALGLSEKDADKLLDLLAENQISMTELARVDAGNPQASAAENSRRQQALQKQHEDSITALLGAGGYAQWQEYQQTRGPRSEAMSIGSQLLQVGLPLNNAQIKPLTAALIAEQQRQRQNPQPNLNLPPNADPQARAAAQEESRRRQEDSQRRMLAAMAPTLTAQQLAVFREQFEIQENMSRASSRARERATAARGQ